MRSPNPCVRAAGEIRGDDREALPAKIAGIQSRARSELRRLARLATYRGHHDAELVDSLRELDGVRAILADDPEDVVRDLLMLRACRGEAHAEGAGRNHRWREVVEG